jgi:hypothetical protein
VREARFEIPLDIPLTPRAKFIFKKYLESVIPQLDAPYGIPGKDCGVGFIWATRGGMSDRKLGTIANRMFRALRSVGILHRSAEPYHLVQRAIYIRDGEPTVTFTIQEEN